MARLSVTATRRPQLQSMLSLRRICKSFGAVHALTEVDLDIKRGEVTALLGDNGADTDNNAHSIKAGALPIVQASGYKVLASHDTWDPTDAQQWVAGQITRFGHKIIGIYSANDTNASSAIAALKTAGWSDKQIGALNLTGLDASVQGLQNILAGLQLMTTYNAFKLEATMAAKAAVQMALGQKPDSNGTVSGHPAFLNPPQAITIKNIESTVIKDGFWKPSDLCTSQYAAACQKAGIH